MYARTVEPGPAPGAGRSGTVRVGAVTGASVSHVVPAIQIIKRQSADVSIRVDVAPSVDLMGGLLAGDLDFVLCRIPDGMNASRLDVHESYNEQLDFLVGASHPLVRRPDVWLADMAAFPWIMQQKGMPIRDTVDQLHIECGMAPPADVVESASLLVTLAYLGISNAIATVAHEVAELIKLDGSSEIRTLNCTRTITLSAYRLIRLRDRSLSPASETMFSMIKNSMANT